MRRTPWMFVLGTATLLIFSENALPVLQPNPGMQSQPSANPPAPPQTPSAAAPAKRKHSYFDDFLVRGTVFTPQGLSFPGAELRIRRTREKKFRWETRTNARGEFAIRVPPGADYEVVVHAKGFAEQSRPLNAKAGSEESMVFRMQALPGKSGGRS